MEGSKFRVIIVGGSVTGLVLAHCLNRAGIDHLILEKGSEVAPDIGASIGIMPNGARILEQLGFYEKIERCIEPMSTSHITFPDGLALESRYPQDIHERFGYSVAFLARTEFLRIAYESYPEKTKVITGKKVTEVKHCQGGICAVTDDGSVYQGSLVVGADGVHSRIRSEMWRMANKDALESISDKEKKSMTVEYACVFGIASGIKCLGDGDQVNAFLDGAAVLMIQGKGDRTFWFLFKKLDQKYVYPDAPRFSMDDAEKLCSEMKDVRLYQELCVGDLWRNKQIAAMTALEEGLFKTWFYDRMVLLGDSVHKVSQSFLPGHGVLFAKANNDCHQMTPNFGQGANCAIEDAAALASLLQTLLRGNPTQQPSLVQIRNTLQAYQDKRYPRVRGIYDDSWTVCRIHSRDGLLNKLVGRYYTQWNTSLPANIASKVFVGGETLSFLPVLVRPGRGWQSRSRSGKYGVWSYAVLFVFIAMLAQGFISFSDKLLFLE